MIDEGTAAWRREHGPNTNPPPTRGRPASPSMDPQRLRELAAKVDADTAAWRGEYLDLAKCWGFDSDQVRAHLDKVVAVRT